MSKVDAYKQITKYSSKKILAEGKLIEAKDTYRLEAVNECVGNLSKLLKEKGEVTERDIKEVVNELSLDIRDIYVK